MIVLKLLAALWLVLGAMLAGYVTRAYLSRPRAGDDRRAALTVTGAVCGTLGLCALALLKAVKP
ncbi:hypothetical protein [Celeribacter sp.]|uniref:hypothetical protein n=1 Tax=Celeribacter sp. TaxID=1890673 RepID=UPI003A90D71A